MKMDEGEHFGGNFSMRKMTFRTSTFNNVDQKHRRSPVDKSYDERADRHVVASMYELLALFGKRHACYLFITRN